ncbi:MAG: creatininase family protein [Candidatus Schekmanbacteria bacterium]|nr:creatininase family protein [Candidatus Schekmanbacteria bacterium]
MSRIVQWNELTGRDFARLEPRRAVAVCVLSPMEVHGPHLPVHTDMLEAGALADRMLDKLAGDDAELTFVRTPPLFVATDVVPQRGSLQFRASTVVAVATDLGRSLAAQGFRHIWVMSFHGGPRHFLALEKAATDVSVRYGCRMVSFFSLLLSRLTQGSHELGDVLKGVAGLDRELLKGDTHGGLVETALMLHLDGDRVARDYAELERKTVEMAFAQGTSSLVEPGGSGVGRIAQILRRFVFSRRYFEDNTYSGAPGAGAAETGAAILDVLAEHAAAAARELLAETVPLERCHSPIWPLRHLFLSGTLERALDRVLGFKSAVF